MAHIIPWVGTAAPATITMVESANPEDMQTRVQAVIDAAILAGDQILDMELSGAGDGHAFVMAIMVGAGIATVAGTAIRVYMAQSQDTLETASAAAIAGLVATNVDGHGIAGSSQGRRWMGAFLTTPAA